MNRVLARVLKVILWSALSLVVLAAFLIKISRSIFRVSFPAILKTFPILPPGYPVDNTRTCAKSILIFLLFSPKICQMFVNGHYTPSIGLPQ